MVVAIAAAVMGLAALGAGATSSARQKRSATMIASAIRVAYGHANASAKPTRLVFNFEDQSVTLEEGNGKMSLVRNDLTGGAAAASEIERKAHEAAEAIVKGPRPPKPTFRPTKAYGFTPDKGKQGKQMESKIKFLQIETAHQDEAIRAGRAYLYFWPGGQTERAAIQISIGGSELDEDVMTILVSPLTGKAEIKKGRYLMARPRDDSEESERRDGF